VLLTRKEEEEKCDRGDNTEAKKRFSVRKEEKILDRMEKETRGSDRGERGGEIRSGVTAKPGLTDSAIELT